MAPGFGASTVVSPAFFGAFRPGVLDVVVVLQADHGIGGLFLSGGAAPPPSPGSVTVNGNTITASFQRPPTDEGLPQDYQVNSGRVSVDPSTMPRFRLRAGE